MCWPKISQMFGQHTKTFGFFYALLARNTRMSSPDFTPMRRIAILNRGEPAVRFLRALHEYNLERGTTIEAVAFYTTPDRQSPFVRQSDDAVAMGEPMRPTAAGGQISAYCDHAYVLGLLKEHRCDGVWPGWGFVAEDAEFVAKLEQEGIRFIGPSSQAMHKLGDKIEAKYLAQDSGVPLAPWTEVKKGWDEKTTLEEAKKVGFPLMVKASAGGGGRGIRKVNRPEDLLPALKSVQDEVARVFGAGGVLLEACLTQARHIEVQLVVNAQGEAFALGVRDCSIQRKNQKVIEEAPSPILPPEMQQTLCQASEALARKANYQGAGTAEFLYNPTTGQASFLEVNSRLQVEHTITEMILRTDLVKAQLDIAHGVPWRPDTLEALGHAIELRVNAENPEENFRPSPGTLLRFRPPSGPGVRVDSGVTEGSEIAPQFDSMIAKIITWAPTREQAIARALRACRELDAVIEDGATNQALLCALLEHPAFLDGSADTAWLDRAMEAREVVLLTGEMEAVFVAAILEYQRLRQGERSRFFAQAQDGIPQRVPELKGLSVDLRLRGQNHTVEVCAMDHTRYMLTLGHEPEAPVVLVTFEIHAPNVAELWHQDHSHKILFAHGSAGIHVEVDGCAHGVERMTGGVIQAPAPAVVVEVSVAEGDVVAPGDLLCTLEAMKMETGVYAQQAGRVSAILCLPNQQVPTGTPLLIVEPFEDEASQGAQQETKEREAIPPTPMRIDALYDDQGTPWPGAIDAMDPAEARATVAELVDLLRAVMTGFELAPGVREKLERLMEGSEAFGKTKEVTLWLPLLEVLAMFADTSAVIDRDILLQMPDNTSLPADVAFYDFCRSHHDGAKGVIAPFEPYLRRALGWFGADLEPGDLTRDALWRIVLAHRDDALRHQLVSALLRIAITLSAHAADPGTPELRHTLEAIARTARPAYPFVRDNARQASYVIFDRPRYELNHEVLQQQVDEVFSQISHIQDDDPHLHDNLAHMATYPHAIQSMLFDKILGSVAPLRALEALLHRLYAGTAMAWLEDLELANFRGLRLQGERSEVEAWCVESADLLALLGAIEDRGSPGVAVEVVLRDVPGDEVLQSLEGNLLLQGIRRLTLTWKDGQPHHRTYAPGDEGLAQVSILQDMHPDAAARIRLSRLDSFALTKLGSHDRVYAFYGKARSNPKDERVFICAEVFGTPGEGKEEMLWNFNQVFFEGLRTLREVQQGRATRQRLRWNWLMITVHTPIELGQDEILEFARQLEPYTHGLSIKEIHIQLPFVLGGKRSEMELVIRKPGRHRMEIERRVPTDEPIAVMTPYDMKVLSARKRGFVPPYEVIRMLEGNTNHTQGQTPHKDLKEGRFQEYDFGANEQFLPALRPFGENQCSVVTGIITNRTRRYPEGMRRVWIGSDPTFAMGALAEPECKRIMAAIDLATKEQLPIEWLPISSGAMIAMDSGTENLDWTARVLGKIVEFTQRGGQINVLVHGINVGAQSYWNAEATMLMHCNGILIQTLDGAMVLTGKKALDFSGSVSAEDERGIGGAERIMGPNSQAQCIAQDLGDAYSILFDWYHSTYRAPGEERPRRFDTQDPPGRNVLTTPYEADATFETLGDIFDLKKNPGRKKPFAIREVMRAVGDQDGVVLERFRQWKSAESAVVWETSIGGHAVTLLGIESRPLPRRGRIPMDGPESWMGGTLFPQSSKKVARALNAASGQRPVVVLANLSGFDGSPESMRNWQLEYGAEIGRAVVNFKGPIVFVVIGRYHGGAYVVFSKGLNPNLRALALEGSYASVIGGAPAAAVVFPREVSARVERDERVVQAREAIAQAPGAKRLALREKLEAVRYEVMLEKRGEVAVEFDTIHSVYRAVEVGSLDGVIPAKELRPAIIQELDDAIKGGPHTRPGSVRAPEVRATAE